MITVNSVHIPNKNELVIDYLGDDRAMWVGQQQKIMLREGEHFIKTRVSQNIKAIFAL